MHETDNHTQDAKKRILILNFIHRKVKHVTERKVPVLDRENDSRDIEVYHRETFQGVELDVCVYWPPRAKGDYKSCVAMVKFTSEDPSAENAVNGRIETDAAWNADVKTDAFTLKNDKLLGNYWAPRWKVCPTTCPLHGILRPCHLLLITLAKDGLIHGKGLIILTASQYVVNALKHTAYFRYEKNGDQKPPEPTLIAEAEDARGNESQEEREEKMSVFMGSTGKIIGPKGAKINEIKLASGVKDVKMPPKRDEGEPRPKARSLVEVTIIGKPRTIAKARELIQRVVDEWVCLYPKLFRCIMSFDLLHV